MFHAKTVRLAEKVHKDARRYAQTEGLSLNALISVALREYLDKKRLAASIKGPVEVVAVTPLAADLATQLRAFQESQMVVKIGKGR